MEIGRVSAFLYGRATAPVGRRGAAPVEPSPAVTERASARANVRPERVIEGELLQHSRGFKQSTQDFLDSRDQQAQSATQQRAGHRNAFSSSNRQALGLYLNNTRPETRQSLTQGQSVDAFV